MRRVVRNIGALAGITLMLSACSVGLNVHSSARAVPPKVGDCFAKEIADLDDVAPDLRTRVKCGAPHIYEITSVVDVPVRFQEGTTKERLATRKKLAGVKESNPLKDKFQKYLSDKCAPEQLKMTGLDRLRPNGRKPMAAGVRAELGGATSWINLSPPKTWSAGKGKVYCSYRFNKPGKDQDQAPARAVRSKNQKPAMTSFLTKNFPIEVRQCVSRSSHGSDFGSCTKGHLGEALFSYDAAATFGPKFIKELSEHGLRDEQRDKLNQPCIAALPKLLGSDYDKLLTAEAEIGGSGWTGVGGYFPTHCVVVARSNANLDLPPGSVFDNPKSVKPESSSPGLPV